MNRSLAGIPRRAVRRAARSRCQAVSRDAFELLGERILDVSPRGMLVACDAHAALGEPVILSFETPDTDPIWLDAEAEVARIVHGYRFGDPGLCLGLRFTYFERSSQHELLARLAGFPPPVPRRRLASPRARMDAGDSVLVRPIVRVSPARGGFPLGVLSA